MFFSEITINAKAVDRPRNYRSITSFPWPAVAVMTSVTCKPYAAPAIAERNITLIPGSIGGLPSSTTHHQVLFCSYSNNLISKSLL
jgi:hypothetical protein